MNSMLVRTMIGDKDTNRLIELGVEALVDNHLDHATTYFKRAAIRGNLWANRYYALLRYEENAAFSRDLILCAEGRI